MQLHAYIYRRYFIRINPWVTSIVAHLVMPPPMFTRTCLIASAWISEDWYVTSHKKKKHWKTCSFWVWWKSYFFISCVATQIFVETKPVQITSMFFCSYHFMFPPPSCHVLYVMNFPHSLESFLILTCLSSVIFGSFSWGASSYTAWFHMLIWWFPRRLITLHY